MLKKLGYGLLAIICLFCLVNCSKIMYGIRQGKGQMRIVKEAKEFEHFLSDSTFSEDMKAKIHLVKEIKKFCLDSLKLEYGDNYSKLFDQKGEPGMYVLTGSEPYSLTPYRWSFPFLGKFNYKGFFEKDRGLKAQKEIIEEGYDSDLSEVNAWSTLGWFDDPVMSYMLGLEEPKLARLLIHEITHYNIFVKDDIQYNENLASFIGDMAAIRYLKAKYGDEDSIVTNYMNFLEDVETFSQYMILSARSLNADYTKIAVYSEERKKTEKQRLISEIMDGLAEVKFHKPNFAARVLDKRDQINNTFFTDFLTYRLENQEMKSSLEKEFDDDIVRFIDHHKELHK